MTADKFVLPEDAAKSAAQAAENSARARGAAAEDVYERALKSMMNGSIVVHTPTQVPRNMAIMPFSCAISGSALGLLVICLVT